MATDFHGYLGLPDHHPVSYLLGYIDHLLFINCICLFLLPN